MRYRTSNCSLLLTYLPWLTYSGRFTHISGHPSAVGRLQDRESLPVEDQRSTAVPCNQPAHATNLHKSTLLQLMVSKHTAEVRTYVGTGMMMYLTPYYHSWFPRCLVTSVTTDYVWLLETLTSTHSMSDHWLCVTSWDTDLHSQHVWPLTMCDFLRHWPPLTACHDISCLDVLTFQFVLAVDFYVQWL